MKDITIQSRFFDVYALTDDEIHIVEVFKADSEDQACELFKHENPDKKFIRVGANKSFNWTAIEKKYGQLVAK